MKYREHLERAKEIGENICIIEILLRLGKNEEWCSKVLEVN